LETNIKTKWNDLEEKILALEKKQVGYFHFPKPFRTLFFVCWLSYQIRGDEQEEKEEKEEKEKGKAKRALWITQAKEYSVKLWSWPIEF